MLSMPDAIVILGFLVTITVAIIRFVPRKVEVDGSKCPEIESINAEIKGLNSDIDKIYGDYDVLKERVIKTETRLQYHAETLDRFETLFGEINRKLDKLLNR